MNADPQLAVQMGIRITDKNRERLVGTMPVAGNRQPFGLLHGGASAVLAETLGSVAANLYAADHGSVALGVELSCSHHSAVSEGVVTAVVTPLHVGRRWSTFEIVITDERGVRVCSARLSCALRSKERSNGTADTRSGRLEGLPNGAGYLDLGNAGAEDDSAAQLRLFADAGGTLIDTPNVYQNGASEAVIGRLLSTGFVRDDFVVATKSCLIPGKQPMQVGASRATMLTQLDDSLRRLRTDHVDLWQVHLWDWKHPIEETLSALDYAVSSGKVRAVGVCNYCGWQLATAATIQRVTGQTPLATAEVEYSLLQRGIEREVLPAAQESGIGILPWAPLGRGVLTGKYLSGIPANREKSSLYQWYIKKYAADDRCAEIVHAVARCADELDVTPGVVALSWVRDRPGVVAPLVGARTADQLAESLHAESVALPDTIRQRLDEITEPSMSYPERQFGGGGSACPHDGGRF